MEGNEFLDKLASGKIRRRDFNKILAGTGLSLISIPLISRSGKAAVEDHPLVFTWAGYEEEGFHTNYIDQYGESPNYTFFGDEEEAFAKLRAGFKPDISMPCSYKIPQWRDAGILAPIDVDQLGNWADCLEAVKNVPGIVVNGQRHWVCMDWAQTSITYRTDLVEIEEESWGLLWDERYKGRLAMIDSLIDGVMVAAIYGGAKDPYDMTAEEVQRTKELLQEQLPLLRFYSNDMTTVQQALASGEIVAGVTWNDSALWLQEDGVPVKFMNPKEGAMTWTCGISLQADADPAKIDRAYVLIDAMLSPEAGAYEIMEWGYGHANKKAFEMVTAEDLATRGLPKNPDDIDRFLASGSFQAPIQNEPELQMMFEEVKAGL